MYIIYACSLIAVSFNIFDQKHIWTFKHVRRLIAFRIKQNVDDFLETTKTCWWIHLEKVCNIYTRHQNSSEANQLKSGFRGPVGIFNAAPARAIWALIPTGMLIYVSYNTIATQTALIVYFKSIIKTQQNIEGTHFQSKVKKISF